MARPTSGRAYSVNNTATVAEQQVECYELRLTGMAFRQIATATGLSVGTVHARIEAEIAERVLPLADAVRKMEVDRLDLWLSKLEAEMDKDPVRAIPVAVRVSERRAKLLGLDAPEKFEGTLTEITQEDVALAELVNEARIASALAEQQVRHNDTEGETL